MAFDSGVFDSGAFDAAGSPSSVTLLPSLFTNSPAFYAASVSQSGGVQSLTASRFDNSPQFFNASVSTGAVALTATRFDNAPTFYTHTLTRGAVTLTASRFDNVPSITSAALLLHADGTNGSTTFTDSSGNSRSVVVNTGSPTISTIQQKFGSASVRFPGSASLNAGNNYDFSGEFTIECWLWYDQQARNAEILFSLNGSSASNYLYFTKLSSGGLGASVGGSSGNFSAAGLLDNRWNHVALVRNSSGVVNIYANGVKNDIANGQFTNAYVPATSRSLLIGDDPSIGNSLIGYMDEVRVTPRALYTATFTPPTAPFADGSGGFPTHVLSVGAVTLPATRFDNTPTFYSHTLSVGAVTLAASRFDNTPTFYNHTISLLSVEAVQVYWLEINASATVPQTLEPSLFTNTNSFLPAELTQQVEAVQVYWLEINESATAPQTLEPSLLVNESTFYAHDIVPSAAILDVPLVENVSTFFTHRLFRVPLAGDYNTNRTVYVPEEPDATALIGSLSRTVYVTEMTTPTVANTSASRSVYVPAELV